MHSKMPKIICALALLTGSLHAQITFTDVTVSAGVSDLHWDGALSDPNSPPVIVEFFEMTAGAAAGDFDADGWPDLYVTRINAPNRLYRNLGNGTFADVAAAAGVDDVGENSGALFTDIDDDGWLDLIVLDFEPNQPNHVYINQGDGTFVDQATQFGLRGGSPLSTPALFSSVYVGDIEKDGDLDVMMTAWNQQSLFFRNDAGSYTSAMTQVLDFWMLFSFGWAGQFADLDNDTWPDFVYTGDFETSQVYRNQQNGTFARETANPVLCTDENGMGSTVGDYDGDGDLDWFVTSIYDPNATCDTFGCGWGYTGNRLYRNDGNWNFTDATDLAGVRDGQWGWGAAFLDYDNDGDLDLGMTAGVRFTAYNYDASFNNDPLRLWNNDGSGNMTEVSGSVSFVTNAPGAGKGFLPFDFDRDGDLDVFVTNNADYPILLRNDGGSNDWLGVQLRGDATNSFGIGARLSLQVDPNSTAQVREMQGGSNFMTAQEPVVHFGLGSSTGKLQNLEVYWPGSDTTVNYPNLPRNQYLTLFETPCPGDTDGDRQVTLTDLAKLLSNFGSGNASIFDGDTNNDGVINLTDLSNLLANFGQSC